MPTDDWNILSSILKIAYYDWNILSSILKIAYYDWIILSSKIKEVLNSLLMTKSTY